MKDKRLYHFKHGKDLVFEHRLVYMAGPEKPGEVHDKLSKSPSFDSTLSFVDKLRSVHSFEGSDDPMGLLKGNPFAADLVNWAGALSEDQIGAIESVDSYRDGVMKINLLNDADGNPQKALELDGLAYIAIHWKEIESNLLDIFEAKGEPLSFSVLRNLRKTHPENFMKVLMTLAEITSAAKTIPDKVLDEAVAEVAAARKSISPKSVEKLAVTKRHIEKGHKRRRRGKTERAGLREKLKVSLPKAPPIKTDKFVEIVNAKDGTELDKYKIHILNEGRTKINAHKWSHTTVDGVHQIYRDCLAVGIPVGNPFYQSMFAILERSADKSRSKFDDDPEHYKWFLDPKNHLDELGGLGNEGREFVAAYEQLEHVRKLLIVQDTGYLETLGKQEGMDSPKMARVVSDALRDNYASFSKAVREKDWATAGVYVLGIVAIYKSVKNLSQTEGGGKALKWMTYGAAAYAGSVFLENAGYDVLKMAGFRNSDYMLEGTPLAVMKRILRQRPGMQTVAEDFDYSIALRMSEVNLEDLHKLFEKSNSEGIQFIHPYEFSKIFPELSKQWPFDMGMGEKGLKDYVGAPNMSLKPGQRRYIDTGKHIYTLALAMREVYQGTLMKDHPEYRGIPYEVMIANDRTRSKGKVRHLLGALDDYAPERPAKGLMSSDKIEEAHEMLRAAFGDKYGIAIDMQPNKHGHYTGKLMNYPIVLVPVKGAYRIYFTEQYEGDVPGRHYIAEIPLEGKRSKAEALKAVTAVRTRMKKFLDRMNVNTTALPDYRNGKWTTVIDMSKLPGASAFNIPFSNETVEIIPHADGKGVSLVNIEGGVRINVYEEVMKQYPLAVGLIPALTSQKEFHALRVFDNAKRLAIDNVDPSKKTFDLLIGKNKTRVSITFDGSKYKFSNASDEAKLVGDAAFADEYVDALDDDELFVINKEAEKLKKLIAASPEAFLSHLWEKITLQLKNDPLAGFNPDALSGGIPDYLSSVLVDLSVYQGYQRLRREIQNAGSLKDVEGFRSAVMVDLHVGLQSVYNILAKENMTQDDWERSDFSARVLDRLRGAGDRSAEYTIAKKKLEYDAYTLGSNGFDNSDYGKSSHNRTAALMKVFAYYTAHLDNEIHTYDVPMLGPPAPGSSLGFHTVTETIKLDQLKFPPQAKHPGVVKQTEDPGLRGHYALRYFEYVHQQIMTEARSPSFKFTPNPAGWNDILEFEDWLKRRGSHSPLDLVDNRPPLKHKMVDVKKHGTYSELHKQFIEESEKAVKVLKTEFGPGKLRLKEIEKYLYQAPGKGVKASRIGWLNIHKKKGASEFSAKVWDDLGYIASLPKRSEQLIEIKTIVEKRVTEHILRNPKRFLHPGVKITTYLKKKFPWLVGMPFFGP